MCLDRDGKCLKFNVKKYPIGFVRVGYWCISTINNVIYFSETEDICTKYTINRVRRRRN